MSIRQTWTTNEDNYLRNLIPVEGKINWADVAASMNSEYCERKRTPKQCRERFTNYCKYPEFNCEMAKWKPNDIEILYSGFQKYGSSWTRIAESLPGKSENSVKNKFYGTLRRIVRKINSIATIQSQKKKKKLRYESVIRVIEAADCFQTLERSLKEESLVLRQQVFSMIKESSTQLSNSEILELSDNINKFNLKTRSFRPKKTKIVAQIVSREFQDEICCENSIQEYIIQRSGTQNNRQKLEHRYEDIQIQADKFLSMEQKFDIQNAEYEKREPKQIKNPQSDPLTCPYLQPSQDRPADSNEIDRFLNFYTTFPRESPLSQDQDLFN